MQNQRYFFFFKQKTAYEMRISDWSSDVCSSDLAVVAERHNGAIRPGEFAARVRNHTNVAMRGAGAGIGRRAHQREFEQRRKLAVNALRAHHARVDRHAGGRPEDRTSVVSGKRVSVRVDRGGVRSIKKKTDDKNRYGECP